jgi:hypothetical protein
VGIFRRKAQDQDDRTTADAAAAEDPTEVAEPVAEPDRFDRSRGPFDLSETDASEPRLDLGSLRIGPVDGMELRLEIDSEQQTVTSAVAVIGDSAAQLQAFAAPRSGGLWAEIREEIAVSITNQGGTAEQAPGPLGPELRTRMPQAGPGGRTVYAPARFVGVDGPRWFLRAVFSGQAAIADDAAAPLYDFVREAVVVRGDSPMAPREMLPLQLPNAEQTGDETEGESEPEAADLNPFERGPEITEVR